MSSIPTKLCASSVLPTLEITQFGTMLVMSTFANFIEMVEMRTRATPDRTAFIILENGERESERVTFAQLDERARVIAANLQEVTRPGDRVLRVLTWTQELCWHCRVARLTDWQVSVWDSLLESCHL